MRNILKAYGKPDVLMISKMKGYFTIICVLILLNLTNCSLLEEEHKLFLTENPHRMMQKQIYDEKNDVDRRILYTKREILASSPSAYIDECDFKQLYCEFDTLLKKSYNFGLLLCRLNITSVIDSDEDSVIEADFWDCDNCRIEGKIIKHDSLVGYSQNVTFEIEINDLQNCIVEVSDGEYSSICRLGTRWLISQCGSCLV